MFMVWRLGPAAVTYMIIPKILLIDLDYIH
jgi:hypothetical protein